MHSRSLLAVCLLAALPACATSEPAGPPEGFELVYGQDFEGDGWLTDFGASDPAAWGVGTVEKDGTACFRGAPARSGPWGSPPEFLWLGGVVVDDFVAEFDVFLPEPGVQELTVYWAIESPERFVYASLAPRADARTHDVFRVDHAAPLSISKNRTFGVALTPGEWHRVRIARSVRGGRVSIAFGARGETVLTAGNGALAGGWFGFGARGGAAHFDRLRLWAPHWSMQSLDHLPAPGQSRR